MKEIAYVRIDSVMERLLGEQWQGELNGDFFIPLAAIKQSIEVSPQLIVHEPTENEKTHF